MNTTKEIIDDLREGKMVIIVDDEDRENEGDLILPAENVSPEAINFMAMHGRGLICLALTEEHCDRLKLDQMVKTNKSKHETAFTVSIEAASGITTGISAKDRSKTITEIAEMSGLFFQESLDYDQDLISKTFNKEAVAILTDFKSALEGCDTWNRSEIELIFDNLMAQHDVQIGKVMKPIRVALTGITFGPGIFDLILLLGKDICLKRIRKLLSILD